MTLHELLLDAVGYKDTYRKYMPTELTQRLSNLQAEWNIWSVDAPQALKAARAAGDTAQAAKLEAHIKKWTAVGVAQATYLSQLGKDLTASSIDYITKIQTFNTVKYPQFVREASQALTEYKSITGRDLKSELTKYSLKKSWSLVDYGLLVGAVFGGVWLFKTFFYKKKKKPRPAPQVYTSPKWLV